jgi:DNA repair exonuclease SbcCD ATPase subunit
LKEKDNEINRLKSELQASAEQLLKGPPQSSIRDGDGDGGNCGSQNSRLALNEHDTADKELIEQLQKENVGLRKDVSRLQIEYTEAETIGKQYHQQIKSLQAELVEMNAALAVAPSAEEGYDKSTEQQLSHLAVMNQSLDIALAKVSKYVNSLIN